MKRWKPKLGEKYWYITYILSIIQTTNDGYDIDNKVIKSSNCFETKKEAQQKLKLIKQILKG